MLRVLTVALLAPAVAVAQSLHTTHAYSGLDATSTRTRIERDGPRPFGPKSEASGMTAAAGPVIRVVKPTFRLPERDLGIADTYEVLFFGETRLVRLRVHLMAAGDPLSKRWTGQLRQYFDFLDRDGDGTLNRHEAEFAFTNAGVAQMLQSGFAYQRPDDAARMFADLDRDGDGRVSFDEFAAFYSPSAGRVITAQQNPGRDVYADGLTDELFKLIDTDKDGKLSRGELQAVEKLLAKLDADEDDCLSAMEVAPNVFNGRAVRPVPTGANPAAPMMVFQPGAIPDSIIETILKRYDKDKNLVLTKAENPFGDEGFQFLDKNGNGEISVTELLAWKDAAPDLELNMALGAKAGESAIRVRPRADRKPAPLAAALKAAPPDGTAVLTVAHQAIQLSCYTARGVYADMGGRQSPIQFPPTRTGYITEKDIVGPQFQSLRVLFDLIDRDADGRMSRAEFDAFVKLQKSFTRLPLSLVYSAQTPSLFQILDENGDGRLSVREVRNAWDRLIALEPTEKAYVTRAALQPQGALRFGRATEVFNVNPANTYIQTIRQSGKGPLWFRKFDRNGDGELSRSEFPGTQSEFDRIDTNHDGAISVEEAEAADKRLRAGK